tara:strand:+ start:350 stop:661 length:312 start_codon:yes stop_codon:yes gene_type:complete
MATKDPEQNSNAAVDIAYLLASFTDNGRSLRSFINHPQELGVCIITAGLLANSKMMLNTDDAIKSSFEIYSKIQQHVGQYQSMTFASNVEGCFRERPPEIEHD